MTRNLQLFSPKDDNCNENIQHKMNYTELLNNESSLDDLNDEDMTSDSLFSPHHSNSSNLEETFTSEAHTDQGTPSAPSTNKSQKQSQRTVNFSHEEDRLLIAAWLNTSLDPITGSDQKKNQFWKRITRYFHDHKSGEDRRTEKSLTNRWSKISFSVSRFSGHYAAVERFRKSGYTEADKIQEAKTIYKDKEGHQFGLDHCWTLLRFQQKWMVEHQKFEASRNFKARPAKNQIPVNLEDDNVDAPESAPLKRPIGRKAAKEANKKARSNEQGDDDENESSKIHSELEEFRARRFESDRVKAEQLKLLIDIEQKQVALREKEIELQTRSEETKIMSMDTSSMNPLQAEYIISLQREILAKRDVAASSNLSFFLQRRSCKLNDSKSVVAVKIFFFHQVEYAVGRTSRKS